LKKQRKNERNTIVQGAAGSLAQFITRGRNKEIVILARLKINERQFYIKFASFVLKNIKYGKEESSSSSSSS
jgi:hypothetical protein